MTRQKLSPPEYLRSGPRDLRIALLKSVLPHPEIAQFNLNCSDLGRMGLDDRLIQLGEPLVLSNIDWNVSRALSIEAKQVPESLYLPFVVRSFRK